jgi:hypothetical protein
LPCQCGRDAGDATRRGAGQPRLPNPPWNLVFVSCGSHSWLRKTGKIFFSSPASACGKLARLHRSKLSSFLGYRLFPSETDNCRFYNPVIKIISCKIKFKVRGQVKPSIISSITSSGTAEQQARPQERCARCMRMESRSAMAGWHRTLSRKHTDGQRRSPGLPRRPTRPWPSLQFPRRIGGAATSKNDAPCALTGAGARILRRH